MINAQNEVTKYSYQTWKKEVICDSPVVLLRHLQVRQAVHLKRVMLPVNNSNQGDNENFEVVKAL